MIIGYDLPPQGSSRSQNEDVTETKQLETLAEGSKGSRKKWNRIHGTQGAGGLATEEHRCRIYAS